MFSADWIQESVALAIAVGAAALLCYRVLRSPRPRPKRVPVQLGGRLARGLEAARRGQPGSTREHPITRP